MPSHDTPGLGAGRAAVDPLEGPGSVRALGRVATAAPSRYLVQFCRHMQSAATRSDAAIDVAYTPTEGEVGTPLGNVRLAAHTDQLVIEIAAKTAAGLVALKTRLAHNLERLGRREQLRVAWTDAAPTHSARGHRNRVET